MKIPHGDRAVIEREKLTGYLLNSEHHRGGSKAALLIAFGYAPERWKHLADDLRRDHLDADVLLSRETPYGTRYEIRAALLTPSGRPLLARSIWQIDTGGEVPRLLTLFPD